MPFAADRSMNLFEDIIGIMPIAHEVLAAQQHLQFGVGHRGAQGAQPFPGIFLEETQAGIERRAAPHFQRPIADGVQLLGDRQHVLRPHPRRQQRLMSVAEGHVGQSAVVFPGAGSNASSVRGRTFLTRRVERLVRERGLAEVSVTRWKRRFLVFFVAILAALSGGSAYRDRVKVLAMSLCVGEVRVLRRRRLLRKSPTPGPPVLGFFVLIQIRMGLQVGRIEPSGAKILFHHDVHHERNRRLDATQDVFFERPPHAADCLFPGASADRRVSASSAS